MRGESKHFTFTLLSAFSLYFLMKSEKVNCVGKVNSLLLVYFCACFSLLLVFLVYFWFIFGLISRVFEFTFSLLLPVGIIVFGLLLVYFRKRYM